MPYSKKDLHFLDPNRRWTIMQKCVMLLPSASEATLGPKFWLTRFLRKTRRKTPWNINSSLVATMPWRVTGFIASNDWFHADGRQSYRLPAFVCFRHVGVRILDLKLRVTIQQREIPRIHWWQEIQMSWTWVWLIPGFTELKLYLWKDYLLVVKQYQVVLGVENCPILLCLALLPCIFLGQEA